jgi:hypothetical protein
VAAPRPSVAAALTVPHGNHERRNGERADAFRLEIVVAAQDQSTAFGTALRRALGGHREAADAIGQVGQRRHPSGRHLELHDDAQPAVDRERLPVDFQGEAHPLDTVLLSYRRRIVGPGLGRRVRGPGSYQEKDEREQAHDVHVSEPASASPHHRPCHGRPP